MATIDWLGGNGDWSTAAHWSGGDVPGAADDVTIDTASPSEITVTMAETAHSLTLSGEATLAIGQFLANGMLTLGGNLTMGESAAVILGSKEEGILTVGGNLALGGSAVVVVGNYEANGTLTVGGNMTLSSNAKVYVGGDLAGGLLTVGRDFAMTAGELRLGYSGTMVADGAANVSGGDFDLEGGVLDLSGTLRVTGGTLEVEYGTINGGVVSAAGGAVEWGSATLNGVTCYGTMNVGGNLSITSKGLIVEGPGGREPGVISLAGGGLTFEDTQTIDNAKINITPTGGSLVELDTTGADGTLTLGANLIIDVHGKGSISGNGDAGDAIVNQGVISVQSGGALTIGPAQGTLEFLNQATITVLGGGSIDLQTSNFTNMAGGTITGNANSRLTFGGGWSNAGTITARGAVVIFDSMWSSNSGVIDIDNSAVVFDGKVTTADLALFENRGDSITIGGSLNNSGAVLAIAPGSGLDTMIVTGTISGGTITGDSSNVLWAGVLDGVTYDGTLDLSRGDGAGVLVTDKGLIVNGADGTGPGLVLISEQQTLSFEATQTFDNATIDIAGGLYVYQAHGPAAILTLGAHLTIDQAGGTAYLGSAYDFRQNRQDAIINLGTINATSSGTFIVDPPNFTNLGTITVANGDTVNLSIGETHLTNLARGVLTGGVYDVEAGSTLQLGNGLRVTSDNAVIILSGAGSVIESLHTETGRQISIDSTLTSITAGGVLEILDGRNFSSTNAINNLGSLILGGGTFSTGRVTDAQGATLTGYGIVASTVVDHGDVSSTGVLSFTAKGDIFHGALSGSEIDFAAGSDTLSSGSILAASAVAITGGVAVRVAETLSYAGNVSGASATVNILAHDTLTLNGAATFSGGLTVIGAGSLALAKATFAGENVINVATLVTGSVEAVSGDLDFTRAIGGDGVVQIDAGATVDVGAAASATLATGFAGTAATLGLSSARNFLSTISGFAAGDTIDLIDTVATGATLEASDKLVIVDGARRIATLNLSGDYAGDTFNVTSDGNGGTDITLATQKQENAAPNVPLFAQHLSAFAGQGAAAPLAGALPRVTAPATLAPPVFER